jgi:ribosomal protein S18 acetylase RimI-like enzyme
MQTDILTPLTARNHIRRLEAGRDLEAVADLVELCFKDTLDPEGLSYLKQMRQAAQHARLLGWAESLHSQSALPQSGLVWEEDNRLVGNLTLIPIQVQGKRCYLIANVAVHPDYRGRGIGRKLTESALEIVRSRGAPAAWLQVRDDNPAAIHIYHETGFVERARRSSWLSTSEAPTGNLPADLSIASRRSAHWPAQREWLQQIYPPELSWHLSLDWKSLPPTLSGLVYRWLTMGFPQHWSATRNGQLLSVLTWVRASGYSDQLWLAAPEEPDEVTLAALLIKVRRRVPPRRPLSLNLPAGRFINALKAAGFSSHQTLIWMERKFN